MALKDLTPRAEPAIWGLLVSSALAALGSYGLNITDELSDFLIMVAPYVLGFIAVRFAVFAPDTVKKIQEDAHEAGMPPTQPVPDLPTPPGGDDEPTEAEKKGWGVYNLDDDDEKGAMG